MGQNSTFSIKTDGTLWAWGTGGSGVLGDNTAASKSSPVQIGALTDWHRVASGYRSTVAKKTDGTLWTWGRNNEGQLGDGTGLNKSSPVQVGSLTTWAYIGAGSSARHVVAINKG